MKNIYNHLSERFREDNILITDSPSVIKECIHNHKPVLMKGTFNKDNFMNNWSLEYFEKKLNLNTKLLVKNHTTNIKEKHSLKWILDRMKTQLNERVDDIYSLQMAQIIARGIFKRSNPVVPILEKDFVIPEFITKKDRIVESNLWINTGDITTKLHYDPFDNILSLVNGVKEWILFHPSESDKLYQSLETSIYNENMENPEFSKYEKFKSAKWSYIKMQEGDTLFVPAGFWHAVTSYDLNIALNTWFWPIDEKLDIMFDIPIRHFWIPYLKSRLNNGHI